MIVDVDRHVQETWSIFERYAEPERRAAVYRRVTLPDGRNGLALGERLLPFSAAMWDDPYANRMFDDDRFAPNLPLREGFDPAGYLATMDKEGIDVAVLTPTLALGSYSIPDGVVGSTLGRAYGRWVTEFAAADRRRLRPVYPVNLFDLPQAVRDARWAIGELGLAALLILPLPVGRHPLHDRALDPFWAAAQELGVPVHVHTISSLPDAEGRGPLVDVVAGANRFGGSLLLHHLVSHRLEQQLALASLVAGGVLARFPQLRVVFSEAGGHWVRSWLGEMDARYDSPMMRRSVPWLQLRPSEYFRRQALIAFHASESFVGNLGDEVGIANVCWSSDYPHHDCVHPGAAAAVRAHLAPFDEPAQRAILGDNAARCYARS